jgi:hypothetical protein
LPDFVHFDPLGQQITKNKKSITTVSITYNFLNMEVDKSGGIFLPPNKINTARMIRTHSDMPGLLIKNI